jgi:cation diffusion facilitator CzcD-associated flavoprotein CzcO
VARDGGAIEEIEASAVLDCSGTWTMPNPAGAHGLAAPGEAAARARIAYGIPDIGRLDRATYAGRTTLVVGSGHSAMNAVLELERLAQEAACCTATTPQGVCCPPKKEKAATAPCCG